MRCLIISDIHANLTALDAVLAAAGSIDAVWCLGDLVGYGPDPNECVARVQTLPNLLCVIGNHDAAALNQIDSDSFNPEARNAITWTKKNLTPEAKEFLSSLPEKIRLDGATLAHGSPRHPVWEYLLDTRTAAINFEYFDTPLCIVGHTHLPVVYEYSESSRQARLSIPDPNRLLTLPERVIVNPGSVGQPRDRDPRASFAIYDSDANTWTYRRVDYDIPAVQERMRRAGLPERHIVRIAAGW